MIAAAEPTDTGVLVMRHADQLAQHSETPGMLTRTYLTPAHHAAGALLTQWMAEAGMSVRRDAAGNVIGRYEGATPGAPALLTGSHFDTVRNAGKYDGNLGIILPIACVAAWHRQGRRFPFAIEVIGFAEEEGVRFKATLLGSRAIAGTFDTACWSGATKPASACAKPWPRPASTPPRWPPRPIARQRRAGLRRSAYRAGPGAAGRRLAGRRGDRDFRRLPLHGANHRAGRPCRHGADGAAARRRDGCRRNGLYIEQRCPARRAWSAPWAVLEVPNGAANVVPGSAVFTIDIRAERTRCGRPPWPTCCARCGHRRAPQGELRHQPEP